MEWKSSPTRAEQVTRGDGHKVEVVVVMVGGGRDGLSGIGRVGVPGGRRWRSIFVQYRRDS